MTAAPDPTTLLMGSDPIPAAATPEQRAMLEWAAANPITSPHPGMTKDGQRYSAPDPGDTKAKARTRVTTFSEALDDGAGLVRWRHRLLAYGLRIHLEQLSQLAPSDNAAADKVIGRALHDAGEKLAADIGTAIHLACEHHVAGTGARPPAPYDADVDAFAAMIAAHRLDVALSEAVLWVPVGDGLCGTADLLVRGPWGDELRIVDIKTGSRTDRIGYATQLATYSKATHCWTADGWTPLPAIDATTAYIAHLPAGSGGCSLVQVTIDHGLVDLAVQVREARKQRNVSALFAEVEAPPSLFDEPAEASPHADWIADADRDAMAAWFLGRVRAVSRDGDGLALARRWPEGVSTKDHASWTVADMAALHEVLAILEAAAGIQPDFPPTAPVELGHIELSEPAEPWQVDEGDGPVDTEAAMAVTAGFAALDDERKILAASWARGGKIGGRRWAVGADDLTPRTLAIYQAVLSCLQHLFDGDASDAELLTRAALSLITGEDIQPGWETGAVIGALNIDQARRLDDMAVAFGTDDHTAGEVGAKALALTA